MSEHYKTQSAFMADRADMDRDTHTYAYIRYLQGKLNAKGGALKLALELLEIHTSISDVPLSPEAKRALESL